MANLRSSQPGAKTLSVLVRVDPDTKARLERLSDLTGIPVAEAMRQGAEEHMRDRLPVLERVA